MDSKFNSINLQKDGLVSATSRINEKGETIIYWTDGVNPPRFYNIDTDEGFTAPEELNIFPNIDKPININLVEVSDFGGSLISGAYQFAARYTDNEGNTTNFTTITRPIDVVRKRQEDAAGDFFTQGNPVNRTGKSIKLQLDNLDSSYENVQIAVIRYESGGIAEVNLLSPLSYNDASINITYTGGESSIDGSIEEILIDNAYYDTAKYITQIDSTLYMANLTKPEAIKYQKYANAIKTIPVIKPLGLDDKYQWAYGDETSIYLNKSFRRDEVYAFYISFVLKNGQETKAFHIPGKNTAGMRAWINANETYPDSDDWDVVETDGSDVVVDSLRNANVRHHRFPNTHTRPVVKEVSADGENAVVNTMGVKFTNIIIKDEIREQVSGLKFYYAKKDNNNKLILDQACTFQNKLNADDLYETQVYKHGYSATLTSLTTTAAVPFSLLLNDTALASVSKIERVAQPIKNKHIEYDDPVGPGTRESVFMLNQSTSSTKTESFLKGISRIPSHKDQVNITNLGFTKNKVSLKEPSSVLLEYENSISETYSGIDTEVHGSIINFIQDKDELFNPFDLQELVLLGTRYENLEDFSPVNSVDEVSAGTGTEGYASGNVYIDDDAPPETVDDTGNWKVAILQLDNGDEFYYIIQYGDSKAQIANGLANGYDGEVYAINVYQVADYSTGEVEVRIHIESRFPGTAYNSSITVVSGDNDGITPTFSSMITIENITGGSDTVEETSSLTYFNGDTFINKFGFVMGGTSSAFDDVYLKYVYYIIVESYDNIAFRQAGEDYGEINANNIAQAEEITKLEDDHPDNDFDGFFDNYFRYDDSHSVDGHLAVKTTPYPKNFSEIIEFPNRVIRSRTDDDVLESDLFRVFLAEDYLDMPKNRGEITNLKVLQNILIAHMNRGLFKTRGREELVTSNFRAFLGNGNIFAVKPDELFSVEEGYAGLQNARSSVITPMGYFFVDQQARKVFSVAGQPVEISEAGMRNFFEDNLPWKINELEDGIADKLIKPEIIMAYDPEYKRILLTKRDWTPTTALKNATWSVSNGELLVDGTPIDWTNETYLLDESFTISYLPEIQRWASFHSYKPDYMYNDINKMYSVKDGDVYNHKGDPAEFYGTQEDMIYEYVANPSPKQTKLIQNVEFLTYAYDVGSPNRVNYKKTFDAIRISNELQDTGYVDLIYFTESGGNLRNIDHTWKVNKFRDLLNPATGSIDSTLPYYEKKKLTGKYAIVRLYYTPADARFLRLISSDVNFKLHRR